MISLLALKQQKGVIIKMTQELTTTGSNKLRTPIPKKLRFQVLEKHKFKCRYCGRGTPEVTLEIDHVIPVALGGGNHEDNLVPACYDCNRGKSAQEIDHLALDSEYGESYVNELEAFYTSLDENLRIKEKEIELRNRLVKRLADYWYKLAPGFTFNDFGWNRFRKAILSCQLSDSIQFMIQATNEYLVFNEDNKSVTGESWRAALWAFRSLCSNKSASRCASKKENTTIEEFLFNQSDEIKKLNNVREYIRNNSLDEILATWVNICDECCQIQEAGEFNVIIIKADNMSDKSHGGIHFVHKTKCTEAFIQGFESCFIAENTTLKIDRKIYDFEKTSMELVAETIKLATITQFSAEEAYSAFIRMLYSNYDLAIQIYTNGEKDIDGPYSDPSIKAIIENEKQRLDSEKIIASENKTLVEKNQAS